MKDYSLKEEIGEGSFAKVFKGFKQNGEVFAVKELKKSFQVERYIQGELDIIKQKLKHENIVEIFEHFTQNYMYIVMEFCEMGNLNDYMVQNETKVSQRISFMSDMALGVNYLHSQNIIHRDLKPENILLTDKSGQIVCKITDFGVSKIQYSKFDTFNTYIGSYPYMAPEITGDQEYGSEVDIFALGLLFYAVFKDTVLTNSFGQKSLIPGIYMKKNQIAFLNELMKKEKTTEEEFLDRYFKELSPFGKIIHSMLDIKPEKRPNMDSVLVRITEIKVQHELNQVIQRQEESIIDLQKQNDDLRTELHQLDENSAREQLEKQAMQELIKQNVDTITNLQKQVDDMLEEKKTLNEDLMNQTKEIKKLKEEKQEEKMMLQEEIKQKECEQEEKLRHIKEKHQLERTDNAKQMKKLQDLIKEKEQEYEGTIKNLQMQNHEQKNELHKLYEHFQIEQLERQEMKRIITRKGKSIDILQKLVPELLENKALLNTVLQKQKEEYEKLKKESQKEINKIQQELHQKEAEKAEKEDQIRNLRKQHQELQDKNKMKEETIENMQKQNNFQVREFCELQERHQHEKEEWVLKDVENHKAVSELELKCVTKEEETIEVKKEYNANRQTLEDEIKNKDLKIIKLEKDNTEIQEELKAWDQKNINILKELNDKGTEVLTLRETLMKADQEILTMTENMNQKEQEVVTITEKLNQKDQEIVTLKEKINQKDQEILSLREKLNRKDHEILSQTQALNLKDHIIISLEKECIEKSETIVTMRRDVITGKRSHQKECEVYQEKLQEKAHVLIKLQKECVERDTALINKEKQYLDELKQLREDLDKKEEALIEIYKNITELKYFEELQQIQIEQIDEDERRTGDVMTVLQKEDSAEALLSAYGSITEDNDMKTDDQQATSGGQASNKKVIYKRVLTIMRVFNVLIKLLSVCYF